MKKVIIGLLAIVALSGCGTITVAKNCAPVETRAPYWVCDELGFFE